MFLDQTKKLLTKGIAEVFDADYPDERFRNIHVSGEFPVLQQDYPSIWVDFKPSPTLRSAGINHVEYEEADDDLVAPIARWVFSGTPQFTVLALTNAERDALFDEVIKIIAFAHVNPSRSAFRQRIQTGEFIGMDLNWENVNILGFAETPGTPWGTDDYIYEATISLEAQGEFISESEDIFTTLLSRVEFYDQVEGEPPPTIPGDGDWQ